MYTGLHVKYPFFLSDFNETGVFSTNFQKYSNIEFHENPSSGSRVVPCGRTEGYADVTKLLFAFRSFMKAPKNEVLVSNTK
jgi:hypothetical protein